MTQLEQDRQQADALHVLEILLQATKNGSHQILAQTTDRHKHKWQAHINNLSEVVIKYTQRSWVQIWPTETWIFKQSNGEWVPFSGSPIKMAQRYRSTLATQDAFIKLQLLTFDTKQTQRHESEINR